MTADEQNELFHTEFDALSLKVLERVHDHNKSQSAVVLVGYNTTGLAMNGNVCVPCMVRVLAITLANLAAEGITPDSECNNSDDHLGVVVGHA